MARGDARARADRVLQRLIDEPSERYVGTVAELASRAAVGRSTMFAAVSALKKRGLVRSVPHQGVYAGGQQTHCPPSPLGVGESRHKGPRWRRLYGELHRAVQSATMFDETRPLSMKALVAEYCANRRTIRKAVDALIADGLLRETRGGFVPASPAARQDRNTVVLIARADQASHGLFFWSERARDTLLMIQQECSERSLQLRLVLYYYITPDRLVCARTDRDLELSADELDRTMGFIVWTTGLEDLNLTAYLRALAGYARPMAVLDESGVLPRSAPPTARTFSVGHGPRPGIEMGRYLVSLGHSRIAYVQGRGEGTLNAGRFAGLRQPVAAAGGAVEPIALLPTHTGSQLSRGDVLHPFVEDALSAADHMENRVLGQSLLKMYAVVKLAYLREATAHDGRRTFEALAARRDITAWACYNDDVALAALEFCRTSGIDVPGQLSIVGFDDTWQASLAGLTSYNFGFRSLVRAMIRGLLDTGLQRPGSMAPPPGHVVARTTSGWSPDR